MATTLTTDLTTAQITDPAQSKDSPLYNGLFSNNGFTIDAKLLTPQNNMENLSALNTGCIENLTESMDTCYISNDIDTNEIIGWKSHISLLTLRSDTNKDALEHILAIIDCMLKNPNTPIDATKYFRILQFIDWMKKTMKSKDHKQIELCSFSAKDLRVLEQFPSTSLPAKNGKKKHSDVEEGWTKARKTAKFCEISPATGSNIQTKNTFQPLQSADTND
ncbi:hypothetical protein RF55_24954, partial [Lasius niger]